MRYRFHEDIHSAFVSGAVAKFHCAVIDILAAKVILDVSILGPSMIFVILSKCDYTMIVAP